MRSSFLMDLFKNALLGFALNLLRVNSNPTPTPRNSLAILRNVVFIVCVSERSASLFSRGELWFSRPSEPVSPRRDQQRLAQDVSRERSLRRPTLLLSEHLAQARGVSPKRDPT
ncbi:hypothetical protein DEO72_LG2g3274 [Vigna unguiculata]|uniref:Uncharacterized protein n=1 Tax=Vigna unguiculata TaxID=3917 RepID=A0A4D6L341_VIGUN|nr:hypothetical protein DEO72_LG2g3274 [Vigna unguiculata]